MVALFAGCPGPPAPPSEDLSSATAKSADTNDMFQFALEATIETRAPDGKTSRTVVRSDGSARNREGYLTVVDSDPGPPGAASPLILEEFPGAVRSPGSPYWFSGRSGAMDPFGPLAEALPPLGPPQSAIRRFDGLVAHAASADAITNLGVHEVRGHGSDTYSFPIASGPLIAAPSPTPSASSSGSSSTSTPVDPNVTSSVTPAPTRPTPVPEATVMLLARTAGLPAPPTPTAPGQLKSSGAAWVDQIDGRLRRIEANDTASMFGASIAVNASMEIWGYDPSGNYNQPIDTTLLGPSQQRLISTTPFTVLGPTRLPDGLQLVGISQEPAGWVPCPAISTSFTGRGRDGFLSVREAQAQCAGPYITIPNETLTQTATGDQIRLGHQNDESIALIQRDGTLAELRAKSGISTEELVITAESLRRVNVPIPLSLSLPLPNEGPERR